MRSAVSRSLPAIAVFLLALMVALPVVSLTAQGNSPDRRVSGVIASPDDDDSTSVRPVEGVWTTLHRVGTDRAGALDSMRTTRAGRYELTFASTPDDSSAVFFVSATYGGITYFGAPIPTAGFAAEMDTIVVFDTTSAGVPLVTRGRHLVIGSPDSTDRYLVVEVFELENAGNRTLIAPHEEQFTWAVGLPNGAEGLIAGQGDVSAEAFTLRDGQVRVHAPMAPGLKQLSFSYTLARGDFPLTIPLTDSVEVLEVLAEPQQAKVSGARLREVERANVDGRLFRRWLADSAQAGSVVRVELPPIELDRRTIYLAGILLSIGVVMLLSLSRSFQRRTPGITPPGIPVHETPERIAKRIVDLDTRFQKRRSPGASEQAAYETERAELKDRLTDALIRRDGM